MTPKAKGYLEARRSVLNAIDFRIRQLQEQRKHTPFYEVDEKLTTRIEELEYLRLYVKKMVAKND